MAKASPLRQATHTPHLAARPPVSWESSLCLRPPPASWSSALLRSNQPHRSRPTCTRHRERLPPSMYTPPPWPKARSPLPAGSRTVLGSCPPWAGGCPGCRLMRRLVNSLLAVPRVAYGSYYGQRLSSRIKVFPSRHDLFIPALFYKLCPLMLTQDRTDWGFPVVFGFVVVVVRVRVSISAF